MKLLIGLLAMLLPILSGAQSPPVRALSVGDTVPDIVFNNVINYKTTSAKLSDFRGKLVILDFMATTCAPCIKILANLDSLQQQYGDQIQIILISSENSNSIEEFIDKNMSLELPFVAQDTALTNLFPHVYISHIVWISPNKILSAITHPEYINKKNIKTVWAGEMVNWPVKREFPNYDFNQPIIQLNKNNIPAQVMPKRYYYSAVINYMPGIFKQNKVIIDSANGLVHTNLINYEIIDLYRILFNRYRLPLTHTKVQIKNKNRLFYNSKDGYFGEWQSKNMFCIEASQPLYIPLEVQRQKLINDLNLYLGFHTYLETEIVDCLVITKSTDNLKSKNKAGSNGLSPENIARILNNNLDEMPVIDETKGMLALKLPVTPKELDDKVLLGEILKEYGLNLTIEKRPIEFMVIVDSDKRDKPLY